MWTNTRSKRIGNLLGFEPNSVYATKVMLTSSPIFLLAFISLLFITILGLLIRAFEYYDVNQENTDFNNLWNALWLNFVTMSTGMNIYFFNFNLLGARYPKI
jgi:drug/metabolite transporter (DMT)-like permease